MSTWTGYRRADLRAATAHLRPLALRKAARRFLSADFDFNADGHDGRPRSTLLLGPMPGTDRSGCRRSWADLLGLPSPYTPEP